jgi:hypothetical protein
MAPLWEPVNLELGLKSHHIRNKPKILLFFVFLFISTVPIYRILSFEMNTQQGSSIPSHTTQFALPRDIRARGSKPVDTTYPWARPLVINARKTLRLTNTKIHITQTDNTADRLNQNAIPDQIHDTQSEDTMDIFNQNTTCNQEVPRSL